MAPHNTCGAYGKNGVAQRTNAAQRVAVSRSLEQEELRGISRTVAEIHWLLLILVLLYLVFGGERGDAERTPRPCRRACSSTRRSS